MYVHDCPVKAQHDDPMRAAAGSRLAAQTKRAHRPRRHRVIAVPIGRLALIRPRNATP